MRTILIEVELPEDYEDVDPQLAAEDFLRVTPEWGWRVISESEVPASKPDSV